VLFLDLVPAVQQALITGEDFSRDAREPYRLHGPDGRMLDLILFGDIERDGTIWLDDPLMELSVYGTKAVSGGAATADFEPNIAAARMLGRQIAQVLKDSPEVYLKVRDVLAGLLLQFTEKEVEELYAHDSNDPRIVRHRLALEVRRGMEDNERAGA